MHQNGEIWNELDLGFRRHVCLACETIPPFSLQPLALLREAQGQDHRLVATEDDKSPTLSCLPTPITAHWPQASQVSVAGAEDAALLQWQRESETASGNTVSIHSFWRNARREPAIFPYRSLDVFICSSDTEWIMGTRPQAPKTESCRIFCLPVKHQQAKCSKRPLGHQLELWAADGSICLSGHTQVFPDSQGHLPADAELEPWCDWTRKKRMVLECPLSCRNSEWPQTPLPGSSFISPWSWTRNYLIHSSVVPAPKTRIRTCFSKTLQQYPEQSCVVEAH